MIMNTDTYNSPLNEPATTTDISISDRMFQEMLAEAIRQEQEMNEVFNLLGWIHLPLELKMTIHEDVKGYLNELEGRYSTACAYVQKRRERVDYWVNSYLDGLCSLKEAVNALKVGF